LIDEIDPQKFTREIFGCDPEDIGETVVLTPGKKLVHALKEKVEVLKEFKGFLEGFTGNYGGKSISVIRSLVGSPIAADSVYFLGSTPCKNIIYTGSIGALKGDIKIGDIIIPTGAVRGEGASKYHAKEWYPAVPSFELLRKVAPVLEKDLAKTSINVHYGIIYTTDSFAAETKAFMEKLSKMNIIGIDMETSAIFTVARLQCKKAIAIHVVSDNPMVGKSLVEPMSSEDKNRHRLSTETFQYLLPRIVASVSG